MTSELPRVFRGHYRWEVSRRATEQQLLPTHKILNKCQESLQFLLAALDFHWIQFDLKNPIGFFLFLFFFNTTICSSFSEQEKRVGTGGIEVPDALRRPRFLFLLIFAGLLCGQRTRGSLCSSNFQCQLLADRPITAGHRFVIRPMYDLLLKTKLESFIKELCIENSRHVSVGF